MTTIWRSSLLLLAVALVACGNPEAPKFRGTDITGADFGKALALTGHDGKPRVLEDFRGKLVVLTFGFTHCPDICPTTLADMAAAVKSLGPDGARVQVLFVTVDPERDTPELLAKYVPSFHPDFLGLAGDAAATERVAKEFKIFYEKRLGGAPGAYTVDHSAQSYVLDAEGRLRLVERHERIAQDLAADLRTLLATRSGP
ncbi:MAG: SCO family protein [Burkholderiales bacterium]